MRLHTKLTSAEVREALVRAIVKGKVTPDVYFDKLAGCGSQTHDRSFEVHIGTDHKWSLPEGYKDQNGRSMKVRRYSNSGTDGAAPVWSATWHEWGWFIAEIFKADPGARFDGNPEKSKRPKYIWGYSSPKDFHEKTKHEFEEAE